MKRDSEERDGTYVPQSSPESGDELEDGFDSWNAMQRPAGRRRNKTGSDDYGDPTRWHRDKIDAHLNRDKSGGSFSYRFTEKKLDGAWYPTERLCALTILAAEAPWRSSKRPQWGRMAGGILTRVGYQLAYFYNKTLQKDPEAFAEFCRQVDRGEEEVDLIVEAEEDARHDVEYRRIIEGMTEYDPAPFDEKLLGSFEVASDYEDEEIETGGVDYDELPEDDVVPHEVRERIVVKLPRFAGKRKRSSPRPDGTRTEGPPPKKRRICSGCSVAITEQMDYGVLPGSVIVCVKCFTNTTMIDGDDD